MSDNKEVSDSAVDEKETKSPITHDKPDKINQNVKSPIIEQVKEENARSSVAGPVWQLREQPPSILSPISEIAMTLGESSIATPTTRKPKTSKIGKLK